MCDLTHAYMGSRRRATGTHHLMQLWRRSSPLQTTRRFVACPYLFSITFHPVNLFSRSGARRHRGPHFCPCGRLLHNLSCGHLHPCIASVKSGKRVGVQRVGGRCVAIPPCECQQEWLMPKSDSQLDPLWAVGQHYTCLSKNFGLFDFP